MKLSLSRKQVFYGSALLLLVLGGGVVASWPGRDPMLKEIEQCAAQETNLEKALRAQMHEIRAGKAPDEADAHGYTPLMNAACEIGRAHV